MNEIYLIRHGEPKIGSNAEGELVLYGPEVPLSEEGEEGVQLLANKLKSSSLEVLYTSHYPRARKTADIIGETLKIPVIEHAKLYDVFTPGWVGETFKRFGELGRNMYVLPPRSEDQETWEDLMNRMIVAYEDIAGKSQDKKTVGIVGHGDPLSGLIYYIKTGQKPEVYEKVHHEYIARTEACKMILDPNGVVYEFIAGVGSPKSGERLS